VSSPRVSRRRCRTTTRSIVATGLLLALAGCSDSSDGSSASGASSTSSGAATSSGSPTTDPVTVGPSPSISTATTVGPPLAPQPAPTQPAPTQPVPSLASRLCGAADAEQVGTLGPDTLDELSGLAASRGMPVVWAVQDSGNEPVLHALGADGADLGAVEISGVTNLDWEDIASGPDGVLYIADIGDNLAARPEVVIHAVIEPEVGTGPRATPVLRSIVVRYPDGPHDAEALLHDPVSGELLIVTKSLGGDATVFLVVPSFDGSPVVAEEVGRLALGPLQAVTGGDISADGSTIVLRTYTSVHVWDRAPGADIAETLAGESCTAPGPPDAQGEAIALLADGSGYVTTSEGAHAPVWLVRAA
jgi:hypothetical protein